VRTRTLDLALRLAELWLRDVLGKEELPLDEVIVNSLYPERFDAKDEAELRGVLAKRPGRLQRAAVRAALSERLPLGSASGRRVLARGTPDPLERFMLWSEATSLAERSALRTSGGPWGSAGANPPLALSPPGPEFCDLEAFDQFLYLESHTRLPGFINDEVDRMSMAHSVEARVPFLDHRLWEFTAALSPDMKLSGGVEKQLLRSALKGKLPDAIRLRRKQGLAAPHALFWRQPGLPAFVSEAIAADALRATGYFDPPAVAGLLRAHRDGPHDHSRALTFVLSTQLWHDMFIKRNGIH